MARKGIFTCYITGGDTLLIQCAQLLLGKGHRIAGIISSHPLIIQWALKNDIRLLSPGDERLPELLTAAPFDYLFSIANLNIIDDAILALPRKGAINFHDGPLPAYAGLNATSWALINRETSHGITWHEMVSAVDQGRILKQATFELTGDESALMLNAICYEVATTSFAGLVDELSDGSNLPREQNLAAKSYYGKYKRPDAAAIINWSSTAEQIHALHRGLDFGRYLNPLNALKLLIGDEAYIVERLRREPGAVASEGGSVIDCSESSFTVATAHGAIVIESLKSIYGQPADVAGIARQHGLSEGSMLTRLDPQAAGELTRCNAQASRHEAFWVNQLSQVVSADIPYLDLAAKRTGAGWETFSQDLPAGDLSAESAIAHVITYLARLSGKASISSGFRSKEILEAGGGFSSVFAETVPLSITARPDDGAGDCISAVASHISTLRSKATFAREIFSRYPELHRRGEEAHRNPYPVTIEIAGIHQNLSERDGTVLHIIVAADGRACTWRFISGVLDTQRVRQMAAQLAIFVERVAAAPERPLGEISLLSDPELDLILNTWNNTRCEYPSGKCIHHLFEAQVQQHPDRVAAVCTGESLTYHQLNQRANQLAHLLIEKGLRAEALVGIHLKRSLDMLVATLAVFKSGGAYVPLDPDFPAERVRYMIDDADCRMIISTADLYGRLGDTRSNLILMDEHDLLSTAVSDQNPGLNIDSSQLAYVIYTSGSTGRPKGVMVQHRNVLNFFSGMDQRIPHDPPGTWLAVTSLSFDISVLELFWTLARGFKVLINADEDWKAAPEVTSATTDSKPVDFSLFYFSSYAGENGQNKYKLLLEGARFADSHGFAAVWTPERHFHDFGGLYPNPSVTSAGIATITENIAIRAGSSVSPLHSAIRIAEEWSVVDNFSNGRVGISFAAGWQPNDFVLKPENFDHRKELMFEQIETVRKLWRGEPVEFPDSRGNPVQVQTFPRPLQAELPVWITAAGNPETFRLAGAAGCYLLTHLLGQSLEDLAVKITMYRDAWTAEGHPGEGHVTLMLHTFIGDDEDEVRETVRAPMKAYLRSSVNLIKAAAWNFPTFKSATTDASGNFSLDNLSPEDMDAVLDYSFERYYATSGLFGTAQGCLPMVQKVKRIGVDEIACLIDFGVDSGRALAHLEHLNQLRIAANPQPVKAGASADYSIPALIDRHAVTHLQCTPSMARMLMMNRESAAALSRVHTMMVGGEAFPVDLAKQLAAIIPGTVINMYGPTETTIWSSTQQLDEPGDSVPIGKPIANTQIYILDKSLRPQPPGVPGELFIGGDGVVRGYLRRPQLTAERFLPDPFSAMEGARMYRTGDLARFRHDGVIEFLGRLDHQVKIRGYRIEMGEIEARLSEHPAVRESVVIPREDIPGDVRLVGYIVAHAGSGIDAAHLREFLREQLPDYMIPSVIVAVDTFPLTPNGKIDRIALPRPASPLTPSTTTGKRMPESELEVQIGSIWQEVLDLPAVGLDDNFFDLGGHSLLAVQMHARIRELTGKDLSLIDIFRFPTVKSIAGHLGGGATPTAAAEQVQERARTRREATASRKARRLHRRRSGPA